MARAHIIIFKCLVNITSQDFGVYSNWGAKYTPDHIAEQHGGLEDPADVELASLEDIQVMVGGYDWQSWARMILKVVQKWMGGAMSLMNWLWWHWSVWLLLVFDKNHDLRES